MGKIAAFIWVGMAGLLFIMSPLCCLVEGDASDTAGLIKETKAYIQEGNKEKAVPTLDAAFESADSEGDYEALMEIGDLYIAIDKSLDEKAMKAWLAAGRWKSR